MQIKLMIGIVGILIWLIHLFIDVLFVGGGLAVGTVLLIGML